MNIQRNTAIRCLPTLLVLVGASGHCDVIEVGADGATTVRSADHRPARSSPMDPDTRSSLQRIADRHALHPALLEALVWQESRGHPQAVSAKGAIGLAQLMPGTARELGVDPHDPLANLDGGARYLRQQLDRFGDLPRALAAYNAGPARVAAAGGVPEIPETRRFVDAVLARAGDPARPTTTP